MNGFDGVKTKDLIELKRILEIKKKTISMKTFGARGKEVKHDYLPFGVRVIQDQLLGTNMMQRRQRKKAALKQLSKEIVRRTKNDNNRNS